MNNSSIYMYLGPDKKSKQYVNKLTNSKSPFKVPVPQMFLM